MPEVSFIKHQGVDILYGNFANSTTVDIPPGIKKAKELITSQLLNSVLALVNVENAKFDMSVTSDPKEFVKSNAPYIKFAAVYGVEGLKEIIFRSVLVFSGRKNIAIFRTLEEAKNFLVTQV